MVAAPVTKPKTSYHATIGSHRLTDFFKPDTGATTNPPEMPHETFKQIEEEGMLDPVSGRIAKLFADYQPHHESELSGMNLGNWRGYVHTLNQLLADAGSAWRIKECSPTGPRHCWQIIEIKEEGDELRPARD